MARTSTFWQFPVITEKTFAQQHRGREGFVGFPWATVIDRSVPSEAIAAAWRELGGESFAAAAGLYTCCQHIHFRRLAELWHRLGIREVYAPHRAEGEEWLRVPGSAEKIRLRPCALFAVNAEDALRSATFRTLAPRAADPETRPILLSFLGAYQPGNYMTDIRPRIFRTWGDLPKPTWLLEGGGPGEAGVLRASGARTPTSREAGAAAIWVEDTGRLWHFQSAVYDRRRQTPSARRDADREADEAERYTRLLFLSTFSLCPSGSGPNSIRLWESLAAGSIPVVLSDRLSLPPVPGASAALRDVCIFFPERGAPLRDLEAQLRAVPPAEVARRRRQCTELYALLRKNLGGVGGVGGVGGEPWRVRD